MKGMFAEWFAKEVSEVLKSDKTPEDIDFTLNLFTLKSLQGKWFIETCGEMTLDSGKNVILNGWEKSGITDGIKMEYYKLLSLDPFQGFDLPGSRRARFDDCIISQ